MPRRMNRSAYALLVAQMSRLSLDELNDAIRDAATIRDGMKKGKKATKPKPAEVK